MLAPGRTESGSQRQEMSWERLTVVVLGVTWGGWETSGWAPPSSAKCQLLLFP